MNMVWRKKDRPFRDTIWVESGTGRLEKGRKVYRIITLEWKFWREYTNEDIFQNSYACVCMCSSSSATTVIKH